VDNLNRQVIKDYVLTTLFLWVAYTLGLTPLSLILWFNWNIYAYLIWVWTGLPANFVLNYPIGKLYVAFRKRCID
jgi:hypothetical protein